jgi:ATP synthase protein I
MTPKRGPEEDPFIREVRRQAERARIRQSLTFWQGLNLIGAVGWMVVVPALAGVFVGRWIDDRENSGVFWSLSLLFTGLVLGCASAWRHVHQEVNR